MTETLLLPPKPPKALFTQNIFEYLQQQVFIQISHPSSLFHAQTSPLVSDQVTSRYNQEQKKHHPPNLPVTSSAHLGPGNYLFLYPHPHFELQPGVKLQPRYDVCAPGLVYILVCPGPIWPKTSPVPFSKDIPLKNVSSNWKQPNI